MATTIRSAGVTDVPAVLALWRDAEAEPTHTDDARSLVQLLEHDPGLLVVAESDGAVVGSVIAAGDGWRGLATASSWRPLTVEGVWLDDWWRNRRSDWPRRAWSGCRRSWWRATPAPPGSGEPRDGRSKWRDCDSSRDSARRGCLHEGVEHGVDRGGCGDLVGDVTRPAPVRGVVQHGPNPVSDPKRLLLRDHTTGTPLGGGSTSMKARSSGRCGVR